MKNALKYIAVLLLIAVTLGYVFREPFKQTAFEFITRDMFVTADNDNFDPGPAIGSQFPGIQATYQGRVITLIQEFAGLNGTVLIASRSYDWCPYCIRQMIQLQEHKADFDAAGIGMVAITYDAPELQKAFIDRFNITIPVLSDIDALSFKTLGILNENYSPDDFQYGIAHPGMIIIDPDNHVVGKLFVESYSTRVDAVASLNFAKNALGITSP
ncbi:MAG: redoxin domain-containing protein [Halioglobus sp.]